MKKTINNSLRTSNFCLYLFFCLVLISVMGMTFSAIAGGSIFGGKKSRSSNPNGVYAVGVHICSSLECPPIRIVSGSCTGEYMKKRWGVCICDEGYVADGETCKACPEGQYSDGIHECTGCVIGTYKANESDTECTPCPKNSYCVDGIKHDCPEYATCTATDFSCASGFIKDDSSCICTTGTRFILGDSCVSCEDHGYPKTQVCLDSGSFYKNGCIETYPGLTCTSDKFCNDEGSCEICPEEPSCGDAKCCTLTGPEDVCHRKTPDYYGFWGRSDEYGATSTDFICHDCDKTYPIGGTSPEECAHCPDREYYKVGDDGICFPSKCEGFRGSEYGDCYACSYFEGVKAEASECSKCSDDRVMAGEYCILKCKNGEFLDAKRHLCVSCDKGEEVTSFDAADCERSCPGVREIIDDICVRTCNGHGTEVKHKCVCDDDWYGEKCAYRCNGFKDINGECHPCDDAEIVEAKASECNKCEFREMSGTSCYPENCGSGNFRDISGTCHSCTDFGIYEATEYQCGKCIDDRELITKAGKKYCALLPEVCIAKGGFKDVNDKCYLCTVEEAPYTTNTECNRCLTRLYDEDSGQCYSPCEDGFRDNDGVCHECTDTVAYPVHNNECFRVCTKETREMVTNYCAPVCVTPRDVYDLDTRSCVSCYSENVRAISKEDCETKCTNSSGKIREYVDGVCRFTCSGHGTEKDGKCVCHLGFFGDKCDTTCDGFIDNDGNCHGCRDSEEWATSESECSRCLNRYYNTTNGKCSTCENNHFEDASGVCHICSDPKPYNTYKVSCDNCTNREYSGSTCYQTCTASQFRDGNGYCQSCSTDASVTTSKEECDRCSNRSWFANVCYPKCASNQFRDANGECHTCNITSPFISYKAECDFCGTTREYVNNMCYLKCTDSQFKDDNRICYNCNTTESVASSQEECTKCSARTWFENMCYPQCSTGKFRDANAVCHSCDTESTIVTSKTQCDFCSTTREYLNNKCYLKCGSNQFRDADAVCHSCDTASSITTSEAQCSLCGIKREYSDNKCILKCSSTQFKASDGTCQDCTSTESVASDRTECAKCSARSWFGNMCYPSCGTNKFRDAYGVCHDCSIDYSYTTYKVECDKCPTSGTNARTYSDNKCSKKTS